MAINVEKTGRGKWAFEFSGWHAVLFYGAFVLAGVAIGVAL